MPILTGSAQAHTNIALMKYWGKENPEENIPSTSSLSLTLDRFYSLTEVSAGKEDTLTINNLQQDPARIHRFLDFLRQEVQDFPPLNVISKNTVPTAAGLASSASAFAALTGAVASYCGWDYSLTTLSRLARHGSGSATRSFYPDFAIWHKGEDDASSYAEHYDTPDLPIAMVICEVTGARKKVSSSDGMQRAMTSPHYQDWVNQSAQQLTAMQTALQAGDLATVGQIAEANALAMHDLNLTATDRRFTYFNQKTLALLDAVKKLRQEGFLAYATVDAGPNVKIITNQEQAPAIVDRMGELVRQVKYEIVGKGPGIVINKAKEVPLNEYDQ
ncbi:diphosphomevalonate decarboxylase [Leuconostocaceae bacterium ESL0958]|nr:diphosphomevalonate decarboxylase [Leuconostocaceae bacterium ESL0958]